jgi:hypothetical protein
VSCAAPDLHISAAVSVPYYYLKIADASFAFDGTHGTVLSLSGTSASYVSLYRRELLQMDFIVSMWFKTRSGGTLVDGDLSAVPKDDFYLWASSVVRWWVGASTGDGYVESRRVVNDDVWHHVVVTRDHASGNSSLIVDGVLEGSLTRRPGVATTAELTTVIIGGTRTSGGTFVGLITDVNIFSVSDASTVACTIAEARGPWRVCVLVLLPFVACVPCGCAPCPGSRDLSGLSHFCLVLCSRRGDQ